MTSGLNFNSPFPYAPAFAFVLENIKTLLAEKCETKVSFFTFEHRNVMQKIYDFELPKNKKLIEEIHEFLKERPRSVLRGFRSINENLYKYTSSDLELEIRVIRRNVKQGYDILKNVSLGKFP